MLQLQETHLHVGDKLLFFKLIVCQTERKLYPKDVGGGWQPLEVPSALTPIVQVCQPLPTPGHLKTQRFSHLCQPCNQDMCLNLDVQACESLVARHLQSQRPLFHLQARRAGWQTPRVH